MNVSGLSLGLDLTLAALSHANTAEELAERKEISAISQQAFLSSDFAKLEELSSRYRSERDSTT